MKKVMLILMLGVFTLSLSSSNTLSDPENASDCVQYSRNIILTAADEYNLDISRDGQHFEIMMEAYLAIYMDCYNNL